MLTRSEIDVVQKVVYDLIERAQFVASGFDVIEAEVVFDEFTVHQPRAVHVVIDRLWIAEFQCWRCFEGDLSVYGHIVGMVLLVGSSVGYQVEFDVTKNDIFFRTV